MRLRAIALALVLSLPACAQADPVSPPQPNMEAPDMSVRGSFSVSMTPLEGRAGAFALEKTYDGPLTARARGEMLTLRTETDGSAAYVAIEQVEGVLEGKTGGFALVHRGVMDRGAQTLSVTVVPDSATGALTGLTGEMQIEITETGDHVYIFDYRLP